MKWKKEFHWTGSRRNQFKLGILGTLRKVSAIVLSPYGTCDAPITNRARNHPFTILGLIMPILIPIVTIVLILLYV